MTEIVQYTIRWEAGQRSDGSVGFTAWVKELEGVTAEGETPKEAVESLSDFLARMADSHEDEVRVVIREPDFLERLGDDPTVWIEVGREGARELTGRSGSGTKFTYGFRQEPKDLRAVSA